MIDGYEIIRHHPDWILFELVLHEILEREPISSLSLRKSQINIYVHSYYRH